MCHQVVVKAAAPVAGAVAKVIQEAGAQDVAVTSVNR
jgi:hypothetical protein